MRAVPALLVVVLLVPLPDLAGQVSAYVRRGEQIRVTAPQLGMHRQVTRFVRQRRDTLTVEADSIVVLPLESVTHLEVSRARRSKAPTIVGACLGAVLGVAGGVAVGSAVGCSGGDVGSCAGEVSTAAVGIVLGGALVGATAGGLLGKAAGSSPRWIQLSPARWRLPVVTRRDGRLVFGLSVSF
jgi:hypothetical protein